MSPAASWLVDLHMHTSASHDCRSAPPAVLRRARELGLDRIAITDHDRIRGALEARDLDPGRVIVGEEVRTGEGLDLIGLFLERHIPPGGSFREVADAIHEQGGVVYLPHPFDGRRGTDEAFLEGVADCIDAVEAFNARCHDRAANEHARRWAEARGLPLGAGSDAHLLAEMGRGRVRVPPFEGAAEFLGALAAGTVQGRASGRWVHLGSTWARILGALGR
ncbi:MAG TPA: PHP domain-containing protein [Gemmatimonadota bacterium]|nr:PHP domain-containing protein [Gemmatimonadota bacterium]